jgi:hypothetical protein
MADFSSLSLVKIDFARKNKTFVIYSKSDFQTCEVAPEMEPLKNILDEIASDF